MALRHECGMKLSRLLCRFPRRLCVTRLRRFATNIFRSGRYIGRDSRKLESVGHSGLGREGEKSGVKEE